MDSIVLRGLRVVGTHGVLAEEQTRPQPFEVDLVLMIDLASAASSDDLDDTVDYGEVTGVVAGVVEGEHFSLLERLAGRIVEVVLGLDERIATVDVTVTKLRPPVPIDLSSAAVRLVRSR
ncbi:MAG TPA: dihydroneopterin aldolase [Acidimicrobiales bacterium]|nr:dihydroneopterin aldolase [Acidimicrobiales bacterium]